MQKFLSTFAIIMIAALPAMAGQNEVIGTVTGATIGGVVGNQFGHGDGRIAATSVGVVVGGWIGNEAGHSLDRPSGLYYNSPAYAYYEPRPVYYSSNYYTPNYVAPPAPPPPPPIYVDDDTGNYCREYSQTVRVNGEVHESYGTACLQDDGSWRVAR